jgi:phospholipid-translocating ATPase
MGQLTFTAVVIMVSIKMQVIEMHNKSITAAISIFCSVGGWFLWNIILACTYSNNTIYYVKDGLFLRFGRDALWWIVLILILISLVSLEIAIIAGRVGLESLFKIGDVDTATFQALEKDPVCKRRFEEAAATELQAGWDHGKKRSSIEIRREEEEAKARLEEQERREGEVREMLRNRPDEENWRPEETERGARDEGAQKPQESGQPRRSVEIQEMLKRGFGSVRRESWR